MEGWLLDAYTDTGKNSIVLWLKDRETRKIEFTYTSSFYLHGDRGDIEKRFSGMDGIDVRHEERRIAPSMKTADLLKISSGNLSLLRKIADGLCHSHAAEGITLYDVDIPYEQRFMADSGIFPLARIHISHGDEITCIDSPDDILYDVPALNTSRLEILYGRRHGAVSMTSLILDGEEITGSEEHMLLETSKRLREKDTDIIITEGGDRGGIREMHRRASSLELHPFALGREGGLQESYGSRSYTSYGRVLFKPSPALLRGRMHIDAANSFIYMEAGIEGLAEISRLSLTGMQRMARLSPGTAVSGMENVEAMRRRIAVPYRKNRPEDFKSAAELVEADRGGFIYTPEAGFSTGVYEVDFSSLFPSIMDRWNISVDSLNCPCCGSTNTVPGLPYHFCGRRRGVVPAVVHRLISRRMRYKKMGDGASLKKSNALKWVLVTSFGYTGYRNAKFGSIECHEAINALGRETLLAASRIAGEMNFHVLHGIVDSLWLAGGGDINEFAARVDRKTGLHIEIEGRYRWIVFLGNRGNGEGSLNRYYGEREDGTMKLRGIELRRSDTPGAVRFAQNVLLENIRGSTDMDDFRRRALKGVDSVREIVRCIRAGNCPVEELVIARHVSRAYGEYSAGTEQKRILSSLDRRGVRVNAGETVRYLVTRDSGGKAAVPAEQLKGDENYDARYYTVLIARALSTMLCPLGLTEKRMLEMLRCS
jgi:DNA polymerase-2